MHRTELPHTSCFGKLIMITSVHVCELIVVLGHERGQRGDRGQAQAQARERAAGAAEKPGQLAVGCD